MSRHPRVRIENCVATILEINRNLGTGQIRPEIIRQFERLKAFVHAVSEESVDEDDIDRIEEATNQLLDEIRCNMKMREIPYHPEGPIH
ncbi:MAG: hypothetical protein ABFD97_07210 [Syntrophobacter sp.]